MPSRTRFLSLLALTTLLVVLAAGETARPIDPNTYDHPVKVACVGDSITQGVGTADPVKESYPAQLQAILGHAWEVRNFGVGGRTLLRKQDAFDIGLTLQWKPDVVIIQLGTNDSRQTTWEKRGGEFVGDYQGIIDAFRSLDSHSRVWICAPVPMFPGQWGLSEEILTTKTIPAIREVARTRDVPLIDLHAALADRKADFPDLVHPNVRAYLTIAETVAAAVTGRVSSTPR